MQDDSFYRKRAAALGPHVDEMILRLLSRGQGFIDTRKVWGILSLDKHYAAHQIDAACRRALELDQLSFRTVKAFLELEKVQALARSAKQGREPARVKPGPAAHKHVRPLSVYREQLNLFTKDGSTSGSVELPVEASPPEGHA